MEMSPDRLPWFVDAWAVHDGRVFASRRPPDSIAAQATVFLSVPDLEAVPVGRISTALRATRSGFQDGFRDAEGHEIAFETLAQIRDLVRRTYLVASLGPGGPAAVAAELPRPAIGPGPGAEALRIDVELTDLLIVDGGVKGPAPESLDQVTQLLALATLLEWELYLQEDDPEEVRGLLGWTNLLLRSGLLVQQHGGRGQANPHDLMSYVAHQGAGHVAAALSLVMDEMPYTSYANWFGEVPGAYWSRLHLAAVPLPHARGWDPRMRRLVEMQTSALVDRRFWASQPTVLDIAPLVLIQAVRGAARYWRHPNEKSAAHTAFEKVLPSLAWVRLPHVAEEAIGEFVDNCLGGRSSPDPTPSGATPAPYRPSGPAVGRSEHFDEPGRGELRA